MALSCAGLCTHLSLARLCGLRTNRIANGLNSPYVSCPPRLSLCRHYTSSKVKRGIGRYISSRLQSANNKYEEFLKKRFPRFYQLYHTFVEGFKLLFQDAGELKRIRVKMFTDGIMYKDLPYRDMEKLRQLRRDMIKAIPLVMISIPPFANYLVFVLMYFFPRQLLVPHFWTPQQQVTFRGVYHSLRAQHHQPVLRGLEYASHKVRDVQLQRHLKELCTKVQNGATPRVSQILAVRSLFSGHPLGIKRMRVNQMRHISPLLFLTPRLPGFLIGRRLNSHGLELLQLDRALSRLGLHQLSDSELKHACYVRGLNSDSLSVNQCRDWLSSGSQVSSALKGIFILVFYVFLTCPLNISAQCVLLFFFCRVRSVVALHTIVLLSANYPNGPGRHCREA
uniref:LETM1 domain containing 1 n=1 Tax=Sphaeramia orbicularis TaxID=375764 RepID=A0A673CMD5_9TELE